MALVVAAQLPLDRGAAGPQLETVGISPSRLAAVLHVLFAVGRLGIAHLWNGRSYRAKRSPTVLALAAYPVVGDRLFRQVPLAVRADRGSRDLMRFPRHSSAVDSGMVERQETQIVQSWLTLDDILP